MVVDKGTDIKEKFSDRLGRMSIFTISHVAHLMARRSNRELTKAGFSLQIEQFPILFIIYFAGEDLLSQQEIANLIQKDKSGVQRSIRPLERDGSLNPIPDSLDRRKNLIRLTPAGKLVVEKAIETAETIDKQITDQLTANELNSFLITLRKISTLLDK